MAFTEDDERIAKLATALLAESGRADLSVGPEQVVRWRKADAIPVAPGPRLGGRGQRAAYLPTAPSAAAAIAVALDADRDLDRAILAAFGTGAPVAEKGMRSAIHHVLRETENVLRRAYAVRARERSQVPRSLRVPLRHSRESGASVVTDAILAPLLGSDPMAGKKEAASMALDELAADAADLMARDDRRRVEFLIGRFSLAALRPIAQHVSLEHWAESCGWVTAALEWGHAVDELMALTGSDPKATGHLQPLMPLSRSMRQAAERSGHAPGYVPAVLGLMLAAVTWKAKRARAAEESAQAMAMWTPHFRALAELAADLPERWRPALAVGGAVYQASLPRAERDELAETIARWRSTYPAQSRALVEAAPTSPLPSSEVRTEE